MKNSGLSVAKIIVFIFGLLSILSANVLTVVGDLVSDYVRYALVFIGLILIFVSYKMASTIENKTLTSRQMAVIALQGAISALLYIFVKFPLPFFPSFLDMQISEIPALITSFMYGPLAGIFVLIIRFVIKIPFTGTMGVGEIADLIIGSMLVIVSGLIYKKHRTIKGAVVGLSIGVVFALVGAIFANWLVLIPFYLQLYFNGSMAPLVGMCSMIPGINETNFMPLYIFVGVVPFNLLRFIVVFGLTMFLYKRTGFIFNKFTSKK